LLNPIQIDLAMLLPKQNYNVRYPVIEAYSTPPLLGEEVFMAGYSDELEVPFLVDKIIDRQYEGVADFLNEMERGYLADMTGPLIKRAVVGNSRKVL
ncbi:hypothetical protein, partial [Escherichia coli]